MPTLSQSKRRKYLPERLPQGRRVKGQNPFYNSHTWRVHVRKPYILNHPLCEVCEHAKKVVSAVYVDHLIRIDHSVGGSRDDEYNLMSMCKQHHDSKSGKEAHNPILIPFVQTENGKIPQDRKDIYNILLN